MASGGDTTAGSSLKSSWNAKTVESSSNRSLPTSPRSHEREGCDNSDELSRASRPTAYEDIASTIFEDLLDAGIVDVASEAHRAARLGFDPCPNTKEEEELQLSAQARAIIGESVQGVDTSNKYTVDVFGQSHPAVASEIFECMNCGRPTVAGRFAPHLEKCMGKGRKARLKANANINLFQQRKVRGSFLGGPTFSSTTSRTPPTQPSSFTPEDASKVGLTSNEGASEESYDDDDKGHRERFQTDACRAHTYE